MKLQGLASDVTLHNAGRTTAFQMDANAKAFRVLSDTLYQNKKGSMVRETACNAYDSHVMAGCPDVPFHIHLPDSMEPFYSVRDFGLGLDDAEVRDIFTTYFRSTKDQNNNVVGAFGLGSKTPFAYTDAFTIIAIKHGQKRQYAAFIDENGLPGLTNLSESEVGDYVPTDEGNGVEIIVPVTASADFHAFRNEVASQLAFFPVKPVILNGGDHEVDYMDWSGAEDYMNCDKLMVGGRNAAFRGVWIVQGVVGYRMDVELVSNSLSPESKEFLRIISQSAILKFDLGKIEVTPSRETLSYSKYTLANIGALLDEARGQIKGIVQAQIDAMPDPFTKALTLNTNDALQSLARVTKSGFEAPAYYNTHGGWHVDLTKAIAIANGTLDAAKAITAADSITDGPEDDEEEEAADDSVTVADTGMKLVAYSGNYVRRNWRWNEAHNQTASRHAKIGSTVRILVRDTSEKPVVRQREFMNGYSGHSTTMFMLVNRDGSNVTEAQIDALVAVLGEGSREWLKRMSKVALPEVEPRSNNGYKLPTCYSYDAGDDRSSTRYWSRETCKLDEFADGAYYAVVDRHNLRWSHKNRILCQLADAGLLDRPIIAIRERDVKRIENNPKWIPADTMTDNVVKAVVANRTFLNSYALRQCGTVYFNFLDHSVMELLNAACAKGEIAAKSPLHKMARMNATLAALKARADVRGYSAIVESVIAMEAHTLGLKSYAKAIEKMKDNIIKEIRGAYPMLGFIRTDYTRDKLATVAADIVAYINDKTGA